ncbi:TonB-dependent receptor [Paremcibacter congregatus]|uniref:TonB-dependent receptor n=1 Tax=Paremcibacter congregatus TaxID=2043170 RepID=UPI003A9286F4
MKYTYNTAQIAGGKRPVKTLTSLSALTLIGMGSLLPATLYAAETSETVTLEEITVTAQRREQSLMEVPISMTAFSADAIEKQNITDIEDYFAKTPNVFITDGASRSGLVSGSSLSLAIRGISNIGGSASSFGIYVDEVSTTNGIVNPHLVDVERIEILRGPQGTFYGRNASGGVMSIVTKKPGNETSGEIKAGFGNNETWDLTGIVNIPVIEDKLMLRTSVYFSSSEGFLENVHPDHEGEGNGYSYKNFRISARFLPTEATTIDLMVNRTIEKEEDISLIASGEIDFLDGFCISCPVDADVGFYPDQRTKFSHDNPLSVDTDYWMANLRVEHEAENMTFTSVTGYSTVDFFREGELDFSSVDFLVEPYEYVDYESFSEEIRLQSNDNGQALHWIAGAIYAKDSRSEQEKIALGGDNSLAPFLPPYFVLEEGGTDQSTKTFAAFAEATWDVTEALSLTLGGRYSRDTVQLVDTEDDGSVAGEGEVTFEDFSPRIAVTYAVNEDVNLYATAAKGWKSGGLQFRDNVPTNRFEDESLWNYEIGLKSSLLDGRATINLAAFYIDWNNVQVSSGYIYTKDDGTLTSTSFTNNAASASSKGIELEVNALVTDNLELSGSVGYNDAKYDQYDNALIGGTAVDLSDSPLPKAPEWSANLAAQYNFDVNDAWQGYIRTDWHYVSDLYSNSNNFYKHNLASTGHGFFKVNSYNSWNVNLGFESDRYSVSVYAKNAFDQDYYTASFDFGFANGVSVVPSHRSFGIKLGAKFN